MSLCPFHFEWVRGDGTVEGEVGDEGEDEMDDRLVGELSCPLDVQDDQVEDWQEVDVKDDEGG